VTEEQNKKKREKKSDGFSWQPPPPPKRKPKAQKTEKWTIDLDRESQKKLRRDN